MYIIIAEKSVVHWITTTVLSVVQQRFGGIITYILRAKEKSNQETSNKQFIYLQFFYI
jgi:hypothetical protein